MLQTLTPGLNLPHTLEQAPGSVSLKQITSQRVGKSLEKSMAGHLPQDPESADLDGAWPSFGF